MTALRVVVIGAGANIFSAHRRGLGAIGADVVGVYDPDGERARKVGDEFGCAVHPDVPSLLAEAADVAVILAPHPFHAELTIASLCAGKHVLVEKPIAVEVAEADRMVAEAEQCGRLLAVAFQQRTRVEVREARRLIQSGALGALQRADLLGTWRAARGLAQRRRRSRVRDESRQPLRATIRRRARTGPWRGRRSRGDLPKPLAGGARTGATGRVRTRRGQDAGACKRYHLFVVDG